MTEETGGGEKERRGAAADGITRPSWAARDVIRSVTGRKRAEETLRESEERWRSLVESIPDIIMTVDADGTILFINRTVPGFTVEGAIGSRVYDYVPPEHHDTMRKQLEAVFEMGEAHNFEIGGAGPFGRTSWYFNRIGPVVQNGRVVAATLIATDISAKRRAEQALRESEERFRDLAENLNDAIFELDTRGRITYVSPGMEEVSGYSPSEMIGRPTTDFLHPDDLAALTDMVRKRPFGHREPSQYRLVSKSGEERWVRSLGQPVFEGDRMVSFRGVLTDITERKRAEEELRQSEEKYRELVENINETIYEMDVDGRITYISPAAEQAIGYPPSEIVGRPFADFFHPDDLSSAVQGFQRALSGHPTPNQYRLLSKTGEVLWVRSFGQPILEGQRIVGVRGVITDVTESMRAEEELRQSEEKYRDLVEEINDVVFALDATGRLTYISPAVTEISGHSPSEMIGRPFTDFVDPDDVPSAMERFQRSLSGDHEPIELRFVSKSGELHWLRSSGRPIFDGDRVVGLRGVQTDITKRKRAEEALRESEERFRQVAATAHDWISEIDAEGRYTYSSPAVKDILGYEPEEVIGKHFYEFYHAEDRKQLLAEAREISAGKKTYFRTIVRNVHKDGHTVIVESSGLPILDAEGNVLGYRNIGRDITERKRAEEALRESEERYRRLVENINDVIYETDADGRITYISPVVQEIIGYSPSEIIGRPFSDFVHPDDLTAVMEAFRKGLAGHREPIEHRLLSKSGDIRWLRSFSRPIFEGDRVVGFRGVETDITEHRRAEEELRESEARLRAFANAVPDVAFILDENGLYVEVLAAPETKDLLYANGEALQGQRLHDVLPKRSADQFLSVTRKTIETQEPQVLEYALGVQAGRRWFEGRTAPLSLPGENQMVVWVSHDITERKQAEAERQKAREELDRKAERLAERGNTYGLTFRELAVLDLVSAGKSDREIATLLGIRPRTVSKHVENIRAKMGASSRTEAGVRAIREELLG